MKGDNDTSWPGDYFEDMEPYCAVRLANMQRRWLEEKAVAAKREADRLWQHHPATLRASDVQQAIKALLELHERVSVCDLLQVQWESDNRKKEGK